MADGQSPDAPPLVVGRLALLVAPTRRAEAMRRRTRAAPASQRDQALPSRHRQPTRNSLASHPIRDLLLDRMRARQRLRHARGALRRTRPTHPPDSPMNRAKSSLIVVNRESSNRALCRPSNVRRSGECLPFAPFTLFPPKSESVRAGQTFENYER